MRRPFTTISSRATPRRTALAVAVSLYLVFGGSLSARVPSEPVAPSARRDSVSRDGAGVDSVSVTITWRGDHRPPIDPLHPEGFWCIVIATAWLGGRGAGGRRARRPPSYPMRRRISSTVR